MQLSPSSYPLPPWRKPREMSWLIQAEKSMSVVNTSHCGHSAASPHGKIPVTGVEIPGLKGLRQHFNLDRSIMQGWVSAQVAQLGLTRSSAVLLEG